ncbi:SKP1-like protein 11 [Papaver somniferum]|uniref:SKP1-like protein 11 n=1 Tax=Papaver somniferum TaxID=3469 RepID=UPI000E6F695A|nr:SKP1-like protein 11 [Papaver somniferum]
MKNLKIQEKTEQSGGGGSSFVFSVTEEGGSSKPKPQRKRKKGKTVTARKKTRKYYHSSSSITSSLVHLTSHEGDIFELVVSGALLSRTIKHLIEDGCDGNDQIPIPLTNISTEILKKVVEFLEKHGEKEDRDEDEEKELIQWDEKFVAGFKDEGNTLFDMIRAADYLDVKCLMDVTCQACADMIKGKSPEWIRKYFNIKNDFSPDEEAEVRRENQLAFE